MVIVSMFQAPMAASHDDGAMPVEHEEMALFFETAAVLITFVVLGKYLESTAKVCLPINQSIVVQDISIFHLGK